MKILNYTGILLAALFLSVSARAASTPTFVNLDQDDFRGIVQDFSSTLSYTSVSPASALGHIFGFEIGVVGGVAKTPRVDDLVAAASPGTAVAELPDANLLGVISLPAGITGELEVLPKTSVGPVTDSAMAVALKWTFSQFFDWGFDAAVKVFSKTSDQTFSGLVSGVSTDFDFKDKITGAQFVVSKSFVVFEPYLSLGFVRGSGTMDVSGAGAGAVFANSYTTTQSATEAVTGSILNLGLNINLVIFKLGLEAGQAFGNSKAAAKLSFYF